MTNKNMGEFIHVLRKEKGLTQRELAEKIAVSDKTVSKWETGYALPDTSMLLKLCSTLNVSVNELLSGERIEESAYSQKADATIVNLIKENEKSKKTRVLTSILSVILLLAAVFLLFFKGLSNLAFFLDAPSFLLLSVCTFLLVVISGTRTRLGVLSLISKSVLPLSVIIALSSLVIVLSRLDDLSTLGANLAVMILSILYACVIKIAVEVMLARMKK